MINQDIIDDLKNIFHLNTSENISLLFAFNPSHELALADNHSNFTPNAMVAMMEEQLFELALLFAGDNDYVLSLADNTVYDSKGNQTTITGKTIIPFPWGWNRSVKEKYRKAGVEENHLPTDACLQQLRELASREFAVYYIGVFLSRSPQDITGKLVGHHMSFHKSMDSFEPLQDAMIFKQPWSTSGRGNFVADKFDENTARRLNGFLRTQGGFLADVFYEKLLDFAMEFYIFSDGSARFIGYSLFQASINGKYGGNLVAGQEEIKERIIRVFGDADLLDDLRNAHQLLLSEMLGEKYTGFVGIDMMAVKKDGNVCCHPCVEINLRMNMGITAMAAYRRPFLFFDLEEDSEGAVLRSSAFSSPERRRERGFHTLLKSRFISIIYS